GDWQQDGGHPQESGLLRRQGEVAEINEEQPAPDSGRRPAGPYRIVSGYRGADSVGARPDYRLDAAQARPVRV
nr:hypothetical protein [Tanacetum cinerariifolium]